MDEAVAWLREQIRVDLEWENRVAGFNHPDESVIAWREAALAVLDEHSPDWAEFEQQARHDASTWPGYEAVPLCPRCVAEGEYAGQYDPVPAARYPCRTIRLLASGYRHRPGYAEHWGEKAATS